MLGVIGEKRLRQVQYRVHPRVGDSVEHCPALAAGGDEAAPAKAGEVIRHLRLRQREPVDELADAEFPFALEQLEDAQPDRIAQSAEVLRDEIRLVRCRRKPERRGSDRTRHVQTYIITF